MQGTQITANLIAGIFAILLHLPTFAFAETVLEVYETYWPAQKLTPLLKDTLSPGDSMSVFKNKIIIRTSRSQHEEIAQILAKVDRPPNNYLISLRQANRVIATFSEPPPVIGEDDRAYRINTSDNTDEVIVYSGGSQESSVQMQVVGGDAIRTHEDNMIHQVRALEGQEARIGLGFEKPSQQVSTTAQGVVSSESFKPFSNDLFVVAQPVRDGVRLTISSHSAKENSNQSAVNTQSIDTVVIVKPGFWTPLGGISQTGAQDDQAIVYSTRTLNDGEHGYEIKVDRLNQ